MEYHLKIEGIITLAAMLGVLVFYSYITWKWYGKRRIKDIEPVPEIPKNPPIILFRKVSTKVFLSLAVPL